jgi:hypothetical protein
VYLGHTYVAHILGQTLLLLPLLLLLLLRLQCHCRQSAAAAVAVAPGTTAAVLDVAAVMAVAAGARWTPGAAAAHAVVQALTPAAP